MDFRTINNILRIYLDLEVMSYIIVRIPSVDYAFSDRYRRPRFIPNYVDGVRATPLGAVPT